MVKLILFLNENLTLVMCISFIIVILGIIISKNIDDGFSVCIWPNYLKQKDINDMILSGMTEVEISNIINDNTFDKLEAKTKLSEWRKT